MTPSEVRTLQQRIDELAGVRRATTGSLKRAAVRIEDMDPLFRVTEDPTSGKASGSVTVSQFNAVVDELHALHTILRAMKVNLRTRLGR